MFLILIVIACSGPLLAVPEDVIEQRKHYLPPPDTFDFTNLNTTLFNEAKLETDELRKIKYYLVSGETRMAKLYLTKLASSRSSLKPIIDRYLGMLSFIDGDYTRAFQYLSSPKLQQIPHYSKICTIKTMTMIILSKKSQLEEEWAKCQMENVGNINATNRIWIDTLVQLKVNPRPGMSRVPFEKNRFSRFEVEDLKILLKLALYLNQEATVEPELNDLTFAQLKDEEVRELVGTIYFRLGTFTQSYKFTEGLLSPNSENIKGNLYVLRKKYELAYAQFQTALEQKQNSQNAIERLLPLAWLLGDWEKGTAYAQRVIASPQTQMNKLTLLAALLMQKGQYKESKKVLENIGQRSKKGTLLDVTQIHSFVALMENQRETVIKEAGRSCAQSDLTNCWLLFQMGHWDSFPLTVRRDEEIVHEPMWEKLSKEALNEPLKETVYINQLDIEELDDKLIRLLPQSP